MVESPQRIWIEADDECPYFYEAHELHDVEQDVIEYVRADLYAAIQAGNEQLRKDAERYRLLRRGNIDNLAVVRGLGTIDYGLNVLLHTYSKEIDGDELDNAIDDAIRALEGGE